MRTWGIVVGFVAVLAGCDAGPVAVDGGAPVDAPRADAPDWYECDPVRCDPVDAVSCGSDPVCAGCIPDPSRAYCVAAYQLDGGRYGGGRRECPATCAPSCADEEPFGAAPTCGTAAECDGCEPECAGDPPTRGACLWGVYVYDTSAHLPCDTARCLR